MNRHYTKYLNNKYQPLFNDVSHRPIHFECGDGWFDLINALSATLTADYRYALCEYDQIKMRIGEPIWERSPTIITPEMVADRRRRVEDEFVLVPRAVQVKEKFGGLRFYTDGGTDEHYGAILMAEQMSVRTCEVCGARGKINKNRSWIRCLCTDHWNS